ncbi:hypothetical protein JCM17846_09850 [Iodidimonas nitroreducens]|uniref:Uncharacterized protein n=1 Tax=Iodidimonas nitroreducens TaxID=1236968 RepID=A0A5A7N4U1_9PROT|nr:hypothetical protein JCM17846_09850 [Iodidimonas nitroreducens]
MAIAGAAGRAAEASPPGAAPDENAPPPLKAEKDEEGKPASLMPPGMKEGDAATAEKPLGDGGNAGDGGDGGTSKDAAKAPTELPLDAAAVGLMIVLSAMTRAGGAGSKGSAAAPFGSTGRGCIGPA